MTHDNTHDNITPVHDNYSLSEQAAYEQGRTDQKVECLLHGVPTSFPKSEPFEGETPGRALSKTTGGPMKELVPCVVPSGQHAWIAVANESGKGMQCYSCPMCSQRVYWSPTTQRWVNVTREGAQQ